ncbi:MAG: glucosamine-6-phosphate deaminase [Cyanophyceae cyanobacterium]
MLTQTQVDCLRVCIYKSEAALAAKVAKDVEDYLQSLLAQQEAAALVLATGNTQISFLEALTATKGIDWSRLILFHLDEYLGIDPDHPASFNTYLRERVHQRVHPRQFHYIKGDTLQPLLECDRYIKLLSAQPLALCFLGVGENGHLAFNEPAVADFNDPHPMKLVKLNRSTRLHSVNSGEFSELQAVPQYAFTLTIPTICTAQKIICLALGAHKAAIVKQMLTETISPTCPASVLRQHPNATLYLDADAASFL